MEKIVWESERKIINKNFDYMIKNYYKEFEFKYNWDKNVLVSDYLKRLYINSFMEDVSIRNDLPILIHDIETFIATGVNQKIFYKGNILFVYRILKAKMNTIKFEDISELSKSTSNSVILNSNLNKYLKTDKESALKPDELRRLYLYKEISYKLLSAEDDPFVDRYVSSIDRVLYNKGLSDVPKIDESLVRDGISMMYEGIAQNFAEDILYKSLKLNRPKFVVQMTDGNLLVSNYEENGVFQKPVICLGRTLAGISNKRDFETVLNMGRVALETSLVELIASEYNMGSKERYYDLAKLFMNFGMIKRSTLNKNSLLKLDIRKAFSLIDVITKRNISNNMLLVDDIKPINIEEHLNA